MLGPTLYRDIRRGATRRRLAAVAGLLVAGWALAASAEPGLRDSGSVPDASERAAMLDAVCSLDSASNVCACRDQPERTTTIERVHSGAYTASEADERLVALRGCDETGSALLEKRENGTWRGRSYFAETHTRTCLPFERAEGPDLLVCHRKLESDTWRVGMLHALDFRGGDLERRQLSVYGSNARGCPTGRLRTTHPIRWRRWQVDGDPRAPLLTVHFQHRNGTVPDRYTDACDAMNHGEPVFGPRRVRTEYFALEGDRFDFAGATRTTSGRAPSGAPRRDADATAGAAEETEWVSDRRLGAPVCRRQDVRTNVRRHRSALTACYRDALRDDPELGGILRMRWIVDRSGAIDAIEVVSDGVASESLQDCVRGVVEDFEFPPPRAGEQCTFVYPFRFATESKSARAGDHPE